MMFEKNSMAKKPSKLSAYVFAYVFSGASYVFPYVLEGMQQSVLLLSLVLLKCAPHPLLLTTTSKTTMYEVCPHPPCQPVPPELGGYSLAGSSVSLREPYVRAYVCRCIFTIVFFAIRVSLQAWLLSAYVFAYVFSGASYVFAYVFIISACNFNVFQLKLLTGDFFQRSYICRVRKTFLTGSAG